MSGAPIRAGDRVADVLARDAALVDVFTGVSPAFERLRNPAMRKVMARLVTVEQAARVAKVDLDVLLERLNAAVDQPSPEAGPATPRLEPATEPTTEPTSGAAPGRPAALSAIPPERVVALDVREDLREGKEPFSRIMAAKRDVPEGGALELRAIFEPAPLYAVMAKQGLDHWTEQLDDEDWVVWFYPAAAAGEVGDPAAAEHAAAGAPGRPEGTDTADGGEAGPENGVVVLDVRGLEPPEPMVRTLAALETLPPDATLVQINVREPRFLLPQLAERGFTWEVREQSEDLVRVFIRHAKGDG